MNQIDIGDKLKILATDPGSVEDFGVFCKTGGHELVESTETEGVYTYVIKKGR